MNDGWVEVFSDTFLPKVELLKALLISNGIPAITLNQQDSSHQTFGEIKLMVNRENSVKAIHLIATENE